MLSLSPVCYNVHIYIIFILRYYVWSDVEFRHSESISKYYCTIKYLNTLHHVHMCLFIVINVKYFKEKTYDNPNR